MNLFGNNPTLDPTAFWSDVGLIVLTILWTSFHLGFFFC